MVTFWGQVQDNLESLVNRRSPVHVHFVWEWMHGFCIGMDAWICMEWMHGFCMGMDACR